jgi:hypothetical protein
MRPVTRPQHEDTLMTSRPLQAQLFLWITVVAAGAAVHAAQESLGGGQQWQIAGVFSQSEPVRSSDRRNLSRLRIPSRAGRASSGRRTRPTLQSSAREPR